MKRLIITISFIIITGNVFSQWFAEVSGGMVFPVRTGNYLLYYNSESLYDEINDEYYDTKETIKFNVIQSPVLNFKGGYLLKNKFEFGLNLNYANNDIVRIINQDNKTINKNIVRTLNPEKDIETVQTNTKKYYSKILSVAPCFAYNFSINSNFSITPKIGINLNIINIKRIDSLKTERFYYESEIKYSEAITIEKNEFPFSYKLQNLINFSAGLNLLYDLNENLTISLNGMINLINNEYSPDTQIKYYKETIIDGETTQIDKNEYVYDLQEPIETFFVNRYCISLGLRYTFGSTKKNGNDG